MFAVYNDTATTDFYTYCHTLSLHDSLPTYLSGRDASSTTLHSQPSKNGEWRCGRGRRLWPRLPAGSTPYIGGNTIVGRLLARSEEHTSEHQSLMRNS